MQDEQELVVPPEEAGQRLDRWLVTKLPALGRRRATRLFEEGAVTVDGRRVGKATLTTAGASVRLRVPAAREAGPDTGMTLPTLLERSDVVVVDKPAGVPTVSRDANERGTVASWALGRYPELNDIGHERREPGLVHRLDTQTSGALVLARTAPAFDTLWGALSRGALAKRYLAIVDAGALEDPAVLETALAPHPRSSRRVVVVPAEEARSGRLFRSEFRPLRSRSGFTLLEVKVSRAYRHQIRAQLAWLGAPIVGDTLYGGRELAALGVRHALHAAQVTWEGDATVPAFDVHSPLPPELAELVGREPNG